MELIWHQVSWDAVANRGEEPVPNRKAHGMPTLAVLRNNSRAGISLYSAVDDIL